MTCINCTRPLTGTPRRGPMPGQWLCQDVQACAERGVELRHGIPTALQHELFEAISAGDEARRLAAVQAMRDLYFDETGARRAVGV